MNAVVVGVGDELLAGLVVNTNAAMIGEILLASGVPVSWSACVGDDEQDIVRMLRLACADASLVIVTGGLGPTPDDRTREALAALLGTRVVTDARALRDVRARFAALGREMPVSNDRQAGVPEGAEMIPNPWGTAPGLRAEFQGARIFVVPGVPGEARRMMVERVLPVVLGEGRETHTIRTADLRTCGVPEAELGERLDDLARAENPKLAFLPGGAEVRLRFVARGTEDECRVLLDAAALAVRERLGISCYGQGDDTLEGVVAGLLRDRGQTVSTAESCTAGMIAARLASVPGASGWLVGGAVAYAADVKVAALGVSREVLDRAGQVSEVVALAMAEGARERMGSDHAVSVTCVAGPGPSGDVPAGQAWMAVASPGSTEARGLRLPGDREQVRAFAATLAIDFLRRRLAETR